MLGLKNLIMLFWILAILNVQISVNLIKQSVRIILIDILAFWIVLWIKIEIYNYVHLHYEFNEINIVIKKMLIFWIIIKISFSFCKYYLKTIIIYKIYKIKFRNIIRISFFFFVLRSVYKYIKQYKFKNYYIKN